jgi:hypothetical protein
MVEASPILIWNNLARRSTPLHICDNRGSDFADQSLYILVQFFSFRDLHKFVGEESRPVFLHW